MARWVPRLPRVPWHSRASFRALPTRAGLYVGDLVLLQPPEGGRCRLAYANRSPTAVQGADATDEEGEDDDGEAEGGSSSQGGGAAGEGTSARRRARALGAAATALRCPEAAPAGRVLACEDTAQAFGGRDVTLTRVEECPRAWPGAECGGQFHLLLRHSIAPSTHAHPPPSLLCSLSQCASDRVLPALCVSEAVTAVLEVERTGSVQGSTLVTQAGQAGWRERTPAPRPEAELLRPYFGVLSDAAKSKLMVGMRAVGV